MKIGIISDIHGNRLALEAVIEDLEKENVRIVLSLGDALYGPMDPGGTFELIAGKEFISISGNQDRFILENVDAADGSNATLRLVLNTLPEEAFQWLRSLKKEHTHENIYLCHGNGAIDDVPLIEKFHQQEVKQKTTEELEGEVGHLEQQIILCGHTHVPKILRLPKSNKLIVNPGSIGLPAYDDDLPIYHKMESGSPFAKYTILDMEDHEVVTIDQRHINYDYEGAAKQAEHHGRHDWAYWLRTGMVK